MRSRCRRRLAGHYRGNAKDTKVALQQAPGECALMTASRFRRTIFSSAQNMPARAIAVTGIPSADQAERHPDILRLLTSPLWRHDFR